MFPSASRKVFFKSCKSYDLETLLPVVEDLLEKYKEKLPVEGNKVLLKPNLLKGFAPEYAVTTHPKFIEAIIVSGKKRGWKISVGDSPAISSVNSVAKNCGLMNILTKHEIPLVALNTAKEFSADGKTLQIAKQLDDYDVIINLPKLKGHQQLYMTAAVKNLFGCVPGKRKALLHLKLGDKKDQSVFAKMLLQTAKEVNPSLNIIDAITAMAGNGPANGQPCQTNFVGICDDPLSLDIALINELQGDLKSDPINRNIHFFSEFHASKKFQSEWLDTKPDLGEFYFPTQRTPISFHPFVIIRFLFRTLKAKFLKPAQV